MGQYYQAVLGTSKGWNKVVYYPHDYEDGLKLLEHAYVDSTMCKKIHSVLYKHPMRVLWIGDYANDKTDIFYTESNKSHEQKPNSIPKASFVWNHRTKPNRDSDTNFQDIDYTHKMLANHTLHVYLNIEEYCNEANKNIWGTIDPLPILTVVGNGRGGGDYSGTNENRIGAWKWHLISIEDDAPKGYVKLNAKDYSFIEGP